MEKWNDWKIGESKNFACIRSQSLLFLAGNQVCLEGFGGATLSSGLDGLHGLWRLLFTTAPDVLGLLKAPDALPLPLLQVKSPG